MSNRVAVMYLRTLVEVGETDAMFAEPRHPYTRALLAAIPEPAPGLSRPAEAIGGEIPSPAAPPPGCRFHARCPYVQERCRVDVPDLGDDAGDGHPVACHFWREIAARNPFAPPIARQEHGPAAERIALYRHAMARAEPSQQRQPGSKNMTARLSLIAALLLSTATAAGAAELRIGLENDPDTLDPDRSRCGPGFGKLVVYAVFTRDYAVVQGVVMVTAMGFILMNLVADMLYILLNPRLRAA